MSKFRVLLVEDEATDRMLVAAAFRKVAPDLDLRFAGDGDEAIDALSLGDDARPQLLLLDLKLPRRSGMEVLEWIRSREALKSLPVILLTSANEGSDAERAAALGAKSYVVKSVCIKSLREVVRRVREYAVLAEKEGQSLPLADFPEFQGRSPSH